MTDRPIIFSAPMIRALLDGRKTQTRRKISHRSIDINIAPVATMDHPVWIQFYHPKGGPLTCVKQPYAPGDRLWVREAWQSNGLNWGKRPRDMRKELGPLHYAVSDNGEWKPYWGGWRPPKDMPRWASRLTLTVTHVRVQRLQEISEADAVAEGGDPVQARMYPELGTCRDWFADLWDSLHGPDAWDDNPWVCAVTFTVEKKNIDA